MVRERAQFRQVGVGGNCSNEHNLKMWCVHMNKIDVYLSNKYTRYM